MNGAIGLAMPSMVPQSRGQRNMTRGDLSFGEMNPLEPLRQGTQNAFSLMNVYPYNIPEDYQSITKTAGADFNQVRGDMVPQNITFGRQLVNPPARHMPFLHGAYNKSNKIRY